jgi:tetratricopeptide (TPR) repeat protein
VTEPVEPAATTPKPTASAATTATTLYDRYRDALRGGHLAAMRGNREIAARAYLAAAALLPDRGAPYVGLGKVELGADRPADALTAYQAALQRAPSDTAALDGASRALIALQRPAEAADMLDRLAITFLEHDRQADALATIERALELAESRWRRSAHDRLRAEQGAHDSSWLGDLPPSDRERIATAQVTELPGRRGFGPVSAELRAIAERVERASADGDVAGLLAGALDLAAQDRLRAAIDACHDALSVAPADPEVHRTLAEVYRRRGWRTAAQHKLALVDRLLEATDDPVELERLAEEAEETGDVTTLLDVLERHAGRGRRATALDLSFRALALAPSDVRVHLAIARLHLAMGWRRRALDEITRLARLTELAGDDEGRARIAAFVNRELHPAGRDTSVAATG